MQNEACKNYVKCNKIRESRNGNQERLCLKWQDKFEYFFERFTNKSATILLDQHFSKRSYERLISKRDLITVMENGEVIEQSKNSGGVVRVVIFSYIKSRRKIYRPVHIVLEVVNDDTWSVITAYTPDSHPWKWTETYDVRICFCNDEGSN